MATYVLLSRFTQQGLERIKDGPDRLEAARKMLKGLGCALKDFYLVAGQYDTVVIMEAPDEKAAARASLAIGSQGNVRIETLRAFDEKEYRELVKTLP
jgi:uncharacterized protein with GYD domain